MKVCLNGKLFPADAPLLTASNQSFKWGDGLFETMKVFNGRLLLSNLHFERLFSSMQVLQIERSTAFSEELLTQQILTLCEHNQCRHSARVRLAVYRSENNVGECLIKAIPLSAQMNEWQKEGLNLTLYPFARKTTDAFASIKSANFLPYVLAKKYADDKGFDDAILLNVHHRICDSSRANIFIIKDNIVSTPSFNEGCINGVMRRIVMEQVKKLGCKMLHDELSEKQLFEADEMFLTNAIQIIRWVKNYKDRHYTNLQTKEIFEAVRSTIFS